MKTYACSNRRKEALMSIRDQKSESRYLDCYRIISVALLVSFLTRGTIAAEPAFTDKGEGKELVENVLSRKPPENTQVLGLLKIRPADGPIVEIPTQMTVKISPDSWEDIYKTQPVGDRPGEILIIRHQGMQPNQYLFGRYAKRDEKPKVEPLDASKLFQAFAGSDFYLADLGLEFFHWPSQKIVKKEMRRSRSCRVVESTNPNPAPGGYARVLAWVDFETGNLVMAQGYDASNRLLKEFSIKKISRSEGKAQLKEIEMRNDQTDSRTRLEFNLDLPSEQ
jgi:hypothetical protein